MLWFPIWMLKTDRSVCLYPFRVPLGGFSQLVGSNGVQPVQVHRAHGNPDRIPTSRTFTSFLPSLLVVLTNAVCFSDTCFNQLDLGSYCTFFCLFFSKMAMADVPCVFLLMDQLRTRRLEKSFCWLSPKELLVSAVSPSSSRETSFIQWILN